MSVLKNAKDEKFVQELIKGKSQRIAYRESHPNSKDWKDNSVDTEAWKLLNKPEILQRYMELLNKMEKDSIMSAKDRMDWLSNVVYGEIKEEYKLIDKETGEPITLEKEADITTKIKAIDTLNKMSGEYITKVEGNMNLSYEESLKEVADKDEY